MQNCMNMSLSVVEYKGAAGNIEIGRRDPYH